MLSFSCLSVSSVRLGSSSNSLFYEFKGEFELKTYELVECHGVIHRPMEVLLLVENSNYFLPVAPVLEELYQTPCQQEGYLLSKNVSISSDAHLDPRSGWLWEAKPLGF